MTREGPPEDCHEKHCRHEASEAYIEDHQNKHLVVLFRIPRLEELKI